MKRFQLRAGRGVAGLAAGLALAVAGAASAVPVNPNLPGNTSYDEWANLTGANFPGVGGTFPGAGPWPAGGIGSNVGASGDASFTRTSGNAYAAGAAIYFGGFSGTPNTLGGALQISDATPLANVQQIVLQLEMGEAFGYDFFNDVLPVLSYNGGSQGITAIDSSFTQIQNGTFPNPITGDPEPLFINTWELTFDLSALGPITSLAFDFSAVQHSQLYAVRLDQSDVAVPEPGTVLMLGSGLFALGLAGRRRSA